MDNISNISLDNFLSGLVSFGEDLILGLITLFVGFYIVKKIVKLIVKIMQKKGVEPSIQLFSKNTINIILKIMIVISSAQIVGIEMTSFIALLGAIGLAIGMSLKGTLSNFAGGIVILFFKPFKIGDFIEFSGSIGTVKEIQFFSTIITTPDLKTIIIPNGEISVGTVTNYSREPVRRVDFVFGVGYNVNTDKAKELIMAEIKKDDRIKKSPEPFLALSGLGDSAVDITVRVWANWEDYWGVYFQLMDNVKKSFDENNISIPFPQRDIHVYNHNE